VGAPINSPWGTPQVHGLPPYPLAIQDHQLHQPSVPGAWPTQPDMVSPPLSFDTPFADRPFMSNLEPAQPELTIPAMPLDEDEEAIAQGTEAAEEELAVPELQDSFGDDEEYREEEAAPEAVTRPNAWGQVQPAVMTSGDAISRRASLLPNAPASAQLPPTPAVAAPSGITPSSKLPPAPASLPAKPTAARASVSDAKSPPSASPETTSLPPKPAPWAVVKDEQDGRRSSAGLSLREIQEAEAKHVEARKAAPSEARPAVTPSMGLDDFPTTMSWGLASQGQRAANTVSSPAVATPTTPVWGSGEAGPKKTLKQIQEEEESRKLKAATQIRAAQVTAGAVAPPKRGYADLAATSVPQSSGAGWTTIGATGKPAASSTTSLPIAPSRTLSASTKVAVPSSVPSKPSSSSNPSTPPIVQAASMDATPSPEFIKWTKTALTGLTLPDVDGFISLILQMSGPDKTSTERESNQTFIRETVYSYSKTLDGRRFAEEFMARRKADLQKPRLAVRANGTSSPVPSSLADIVKMQPKAMAADAGFKFVKPKKKKLP